MKTVHIANFYNLHSLTVKDKGVIVKEHRQCRAGYTNCEANGSLRSLPCVLYSASNNWYINNNKTFITNHFETSGETIYRMKMFETKNRS